MRKISAKKLKALGGKMPFSTIASPRKAVRKVPWEMCRTCHRKGTPSPRSILKCSPHPVGRVGECGQCGKRRPLVTCHSYDFRQRDATSPPDLRPVRERVGYGCRGAVQAMQPDRSSPPWKENQEDGVSPITQTPIPLSDEWATPKWLFDHFDAEFRFTLDGAAQPWNAKCARFCSPASPDNPVWTNEVVWLNPPYSDLGVWMWKAELASWRLASTVVCLVPCVPDRKWWSEHVEKKGEVRHLTRSLLPTGRIHFEKEDGTSGRAPFPSCIVIYRKVA